MLNKVFLCNSCNVQFLENEWRWKRITIPVFILITVFTIVDYPINWPLFPFEFINVSILIILLWVSNRFINIEFYKRYQHDRNKKTRLVARYALSLFVSVLLLSIDIKFFHSFVCSYFIENLRSDYIFQHRYLYLLTALFVYFINISYERLFLFIELTEAGIEAEKYKKDSIEARFNNLKSKINPHFLFNTFSALSETIEENPPKASKLVNELSDVYRYVLDNQEINWIALKKELEFAKSFTNLLKMRFEENLNVDIKIDSNIPGVYIAPLTLQILIENATKHNEISTKKKLKLQIYTENEFIIVKNNLQEKKTLNNGSSFGLKNLHERYKHLSNKEVIINKTKEEFIVKIPLIKEQNKLRFEELDVH